MSESRVHESEAFVLDGEEGTVTLRKAYTPNGQLLEITSPHAGARRLDAIELESVTWQDRDTLHALFEEHGTGRGDAPDEMPGVADSRTRLVETIEDPDLTITNEYAEVRIGTFAGDGVGCCELVAPKVGYRLRLSPRELEGLAGLPHAVFSDFLERPYGPE